MILVRGIKGDIKLNPSIKLWGGLALIGVGSIWAVHNEISDYREDVSNCENKGGMWVGGIPLRVGVLRVFNGHCELEKKQSLT